MKLLLTLLLSHVSYAEESRYSQSFFKNTKAISSRSITIDREVLEQSYDLNGKLRVENYTKGKSVESICINEKGEKFTMADSDEIFFECLDQYSKILTKGGGSVGKQSTQKGLGDIDFNSRGKNLK